MRRIALALRIHRKTVERKLEFLSEQGLLEHAEFLKTFDKFRVTQFQFDEMETIEHTKLKPLSIALAVTEGTRKILGFTVSKMPATGLLAKKSVQKYGLRPDERPKGLETLFKQIKPVISEVAEIKSDQKPLYPIKVRKYFPKSTHITTKGRKGCVTGQGELKRGGFDPLFSLNHTAAMLRANVNRLFRRTWCTTKKPERLTQHLMVYMSYHNQVLT